MIVEGRELQIGRLDRVVFPRAGTTKAALLDYYVRVAPVLLPHLRDRLLHLHRYPEGVEGPRFWQKQCPDHRPDWVPTVPVWSRDKRANIDFCVANELATVLWAVNIGSIELHTSLHTRSDLTRPTALAFDLDPPRSGHSPLAASQDPARASTSSPAARSRCGCATSSPAWA